MAGRQAHLHGLATPIRELSGLKFPSLLLGRFLFYLLVILLPRKLELLLNFIFADYERLEFGVV